MHMHLSRAIVFFFTIETVVSCTASVQCRDKFLPNLVIFEPLSIQECLSPLASLGGKYKTEYLFPLYSVKRQIYA